MMSKEAMKLAKEWFERNTYGDEAVDVYEALCEALAEQQQEPVAWKNAAIRLGEELSSVGPDGYYDMTAEQWLDWAMDQRPHGKNSLPAQRTWVGLTDEERKLVRNSVGYNQFVTAGEYAEHVQKATEFKLREKNT